MNDPTLEEARRAFLFHGGDPNEVIPGRPSSWYWKQTVKLVEAKLVRADDFKGDRERRQREASDGVDMLGKRVVQLLDRGWTVPQVRSALLHLACSSAIFDKLTKEQLVEQVKEVWLNMVSATLQTSGWMTGQAGGDEPS